MFSEGLRLKGFRGIRDGMGLDEIVLDFERLVPGAELVALAGPNGKGKTTIMDNLHPYPVMPSRAGKDGLGKFSYYDHLCSAEAEKDLIWRHDGRRYRSHLVFRMNGKKKTEAFLLEWRIDRWVPVTIEDGTVSDGKMETYWRCIIAILGTPETFFTSVFSAQGRQPLSSYTSASIKTLFAELLGHAEILKMSGAAGEVAKLLKTGLPSVRSALTTMETEADSARQAKQELAGATAEEAASRATREAAQKALLEARDRLTTANAQAAGDEGNARRREAIRTRMIEADKAWEDAVDRLKQQKRGEEARRSAIDRRVRERVGQAAASRRELTQRMERLQGVVVHERVIRSAARLLPLVQALLARRIELEAQCQTRVQAARETRSTVEALRKEIEGIEREAGRATLTVEDLKRRHGLSDEVPCKGTDLQGHCNLLGDAMTAKTLLPSAQHAIQVLQAERANAATRLAEAERDLAALAGAAAAYDAAERKRASLAGRLQRRDKVASRLEDLEQAKAELQQVQAQLQGLGPADDQPTAVEREEYRLVDEALRNIATALRAEDAKRAAATADLSRQLGELPAPFDKGLIERAAENLRQAQTDFDRADRRLTQAVQRVQTLSDSASRLEGLEARVKQERARVAYIEAKVAVWTLLAKALGNDGIIALSIDDAGPTLSALVNDLLLGCYGPRFTVSLLTQVETAKGEATEGFAIVVHDAESGQSKALEHTSGGERVWINECLTRAIALYLAQNSGRRYQTLFSDEADGALDEERKRMYMRMKRTVLRLGGYEREFFISQTPELTAMADAIIDLGELQREQQAKEAV